MVLVENQAKVELPQYHQRKYKNNFNLRMYSGASLRGNPLSVMMGGYQTISNASQTYRSYSEGKSCLQIAAGLFRTTLNVASFFVRPLGMLACACSDLALDCFQAKDSAKPKETGLQIFHSLGLLLSMRFSGNRRSAIFSSGLRQVQRPMVHTFYQDDRKALVSDINRHFARQKKAGDDS